MYTDSGIKYLLSLSPSLCLPCHISVVNYLSLHNDHRRRHHHHSTLGSSVFIKWHSLFGEAFFALLVSPVKLLLSDCVGKIHNKIKSYSLQFIACQVNERIFVTTHTQTQTQCSEEFGLFQFVIFHFSSEVHLKVPKQKCVGNILRVYKHLSGKFGCFTHRK